MKIFFIYQKLRFTWFFFCITTMFQRITAVAALWRRSNAACTKIEIRDIKSGLG